jgi:hypothetical protein
VHAWWRLAEPVTDLVAWTSRQKGLAKLLAGDSKCSDPARVMRLPGFINTKPKYADRAPVCTVESIDTALVYPLDQIAAVIPAEPTATPRPIRVAPQRSASDADVERRAAAYLDKMTAAVSGQNGHDKLYAVAVAMVHGFGLNQDVAYRLIAQQYNPRCDPPWSEKELWHKVRDAANKPHDRPYGWLRDAPRDMALPVVAAPVVGEVVPYRPVRTRPWGKHIVEMRWTRGGKQAVRVLDGDVVVEMAELKVATLTTREKFTRKMAKLTGGDARQRAAAAPRVRGRRLRAVRDQAAGGYHAPPRVSLPAHQSASPSPTKVLGPRSFREPLVDAVDLLFFQPHGHATSLLTSP